MQRAKVKVIACATVIEEMYPFLPPTVPYTVLDFGLHMVPGKLKETLQQHVDRAAKEAEVVVLGYGLCSMSVVGLEANGCTIVVPRVDDCIGIFLGSRESYLEQVKVAPGSYYLTKGWIEVSDTILKEYERLVERFDRERADRMMKLMLKHYRRLVYIDTGLQNQEKYQTYAKRTAKQFGLEYVEIKGSNELVRKMIFGPWDEESFVIARPGETIRYSDFGSRCKQSRANSLTSS